MKDRHNGVSITQQGCMTVPISLPSIMSGGPITFLDPVAKLLLAQYEDSLNPFPNADTGSPGATPQQQLTVLQLIFSSIRAIIGF
jgi:hypothetical protein